MCACVQFNHVHMQVQFNHVQVQFNHVQVQLRNACYSLYIHVHVAVRLIAEDREQLVLYAVSGSIWPTDSLLDKFRRLCH